MPTSHTYTEADQALFAKLGLTSIPAVIESGTAHTQIAECTAA